LELQAFPMRCSVVALEVEGGGLGGGGGEVEGGGGGGAGARGPGGGGDGFGVPSAGESTNGTFGAEASAPLTEDVIILDVGVIDLNF
jgi:hypothetical protein